MFSVADRIMGDDELDRKRQIQLWTKVFKWNWGHGVAHVSVCVSVQLISIVRMKLCLD